MGINILRSKRASLFQGYGIFSKKVTKTSGHLCVMELHINFLLFFNLEKPKEPPAPQLSNWWLYLLFPTCIYVHFSLKGNKLCFVSFYSRLGTCMYICVCASRVYAGWGLNNTKSRKQCQTCVSEVAVNDLFRE